MIAHVPRALTAVCLLAVTLGMSGCDLYFDTRGIDAAIEKVDRHVDPTLGGGRKTSAAANPFGEGVVVTIQHQGKHGVVLVLGEEAWAFDEETRSFTPSLPLFESASVEVQTRAGLRSPGATDQIPSRVANGWPPAP